MCSDYRDLCSTCNHASECNNHSTHGKPVYYCEEFDAHVLMRPKKPLVSSSASTETIDFEKYKGLCTNCEYRETCVFPKPEGGIWHCREYQ